MSRYPRRFGSPAAKATSRAALAANGGVTPTPTPLPTIPIAAMSFGINESFLQWGKPTDWSRDAYYSGYWSGITADSLIGADGRPRAYKAGQSEHVFNLTGTLGSQRSGVWELRHNMPSARIVNPAGMTVAQANSNGVMRINVPASFSGGIPQIGFSGTTPAEGVVFNFLPVGESSVEMYTAHAAAVLASLSPEGSIRIMSARGINDDMIGPVIASGPRMRQAAERWTGVAQNYNEYSAGSVPLWHGVPIEAHISACNLAQRHMWWNVSHIDSDALIALEARIIARGGTAIAGPIPGAALRAQSAVFLELSNEVIWNTGFRQGTDIMCMGVRRGYATASSPSTAVPMDVIWNGRGINSTTLFAVPPGQRIFVIPSGGGPSVYEALQLNEAGTVITPVSTIGQTTADGRWKLVVDIAGTRRAGLRYYGTRTVEAKAIADAEFAAVGRPPVIMRLAWQAAVGFNADAKTIFNWVYQGHGIVPPRFDFAHYWGGGVGNGSSGPYDMGAYQDNNSPPYQVPWTKALMDLVKLPDKRAFRKAYFAAELGSIKNALARAASTKVDLKAHLVSLGLPQNATLAGQYEMGDHTGFFTSVEQAAAGTGWATEIWAERPNLIRDPRHGSNWLYYTAGMRDTLGESELMLFDRVAALPPTNGNYFGLTENDADITTSNHRYTAVRYVLQNPGVIPSAIVVPGSIEFLRSTPAGTVLAPILNVPAGVTPVLVDTDDRLAIGGNGTSGWNLVVGPGAAAGTAGSIDYCVAASTAYAVSGSATMTAVSVALSGAQSKAEGNSGATLFTYTVTRSGATGAVSVPWSFAPGNTSADDFTGGTYPAGGTVALADGVATGTFTVSVAGDTTFEPDETFTVSITPPAGYIAGGNMSATGTILNDDSAATFTPPYNFQMVNAPGDSRTAMAGGTATYLGSGSVGADAFIPAMLGNKVGPGSAPNMGIGGQTGANALAYPRPNGNPWTGRIDNGTAGTPGNTLTISNVGGGGLPTLDVGDRIVPVGGSACTITARGTGTGGTGTYTVDGPAQQISSSVTNIQPFLLYGVAGKRTIADIAANPAAIILLYAPLTNDSAASASVTAIENFIKAVTNPAFVHPGYGAPLPLYNGLAKNVIVLNDSRTGFNTTGAAKNGKSQADATRMHDASRYLLKYDYASGDALANSRVMVIDTFDDPQVADLTDTTTFAIKPGYMADGLHLVSSFSKRVGELVAARPKAWLTGPTFETTPDTTTQANFLLDNALFTSTSGGTSSLLNGSAMTGTVPANWFIECAAGMNINVDFAYEALGGNLGNALNLRVTGTSGVDGTVALFQRLSSAQRAKIDVAADTLRLSTRSKLRIDAGQIYLARMILQLAGSGGTIFPSDWGLAGNRLGYSNVTADNMMIENAYASGEWTDWLTHITKNCSLIGRGETGNPANSTTYVRYELSVKSGVPVDVTLSLAQIGLAKV